ncbi:hypothetical protein [Neptuniibacter halophilus]|uniref:hypothetical protein n=1 Tax=Neptuniibacter halophilus TaxID=651666 RepID=UPI0025732190|nr:hypothetical protein [Neptuniibacter halophilus]
MKTIPGLLLSSLLLSPLASADTDLSQLQQWLQHLPGLLEERSETGTAYLDNYLQCMDDQQALNSQQDPTVGQVIDNMLDSTSACAPLLDEMIRSMTDQDPDTLSESEKRKLLEKSL